MPGASTPRTSWSTTTWDEGAEYFGVPFRNDYLRRVLDARRDYGLINNPEMGCPLVTGAHRTEEAVARSR